MDKIKSMFHTEGRQPESETDFQGPPQKFHSGKEGDLGKDALSTDPKLELTGKPKVVEKDTNAFGTTHKKIEQPAVIKQDVYEADKQKAGYSTTATSASVVGGAPAGAYGKEQSEVVLKGQAREVENKVVQPAIIHKTLEQEGTLRKEILKTSVPEVRTQQQVPVNWGTSLEKGQFTTKEGQQLNTAAPLMTGEKHTFSAASESERQQVHLQGKNATLTETVIQPGVTREVLEQDVKLRKEGIQVETPATTSTLKK